MPRGVYERRQETKNRISSSLKGIIRSKSTREKISESKRGDKNYNWKGIKKTKEGYVLIYSPEHPFCRRDRYVKRSRLVMEAHLGRTLLRTETVHHINGIKDDDAIENLQHFSSETEHQHYHNPKGSPPKQKHPVGRDVNGRFKKI